jgi:hypothetical protein
MIHAKENKEARNPIRSNPVCRVPKTMVASHQRSDVSIHSLIYKQKIEKAKRLRGKNKLNNNRRSGIPGFKHRTPVSRF